MSVHPAPFRQSIDKPWRKAMRTEALFREQPYLASAEASVLGINERGGIILDRTIFYATSGGQPGDTGNVLRADGAEIAIAATVTGATKDEIIHVPANGAALPEPGEAVKLAIDWERRHKLMRMHTACHLLSVICPFPITGASVDEVDSRVDFDMAEAGVTKEEVTEKLMALVEADHPVFTRWIGEEELAANPSLVKSKNVRPPAGAGRIRLVCIGEEASIDSQPCGGTHVARTGEIGEIHIGKIEKKGRENRRFRIRFGPLPQA
jgi:misacylated tRNA(Ala) deacylase